MKDTSLRWPVPHFMTKDQWIEGLVEAIIQEPHICEYDYGGNIIGIDSDILEQIIRHYYKGVYDNEAPIDSFGLGHGIKHVE